MNEENTVIDMEMFQRHMKRRWPGFSVRYIEVNGRWMIYDQFGEVNGFILVRADGSVLMQSNSRMMAVSDCSLSPGDYLWLALFAELGAVYE